MSYSDTEGDMLGMESGEDNYFSDNDGGRDSDDGYGMEEEPKPKSKVSYVVLKEEEIRKRQNDDIESVSSFLGLSLTESTILLLHYKWSVTKILDEWCRDEDRVRKEAGIFKEPVVDYDSNGVEIECGICFDTYARKEIVSVSCGHPYCITCWTGFIESKINNGLSCLIVKCPEPSCSAAVGQDMILEFIKVEDVEKYYRFIFKSYAEDGVKKIKWCPSAGCEYAIDLESGSKNYDVSCLCSNSFCWNCSEEAHRPLDCETVAKWIFKSNDESENTNWILVNTKPCPGCKRQIEKNQGCNHMICSQCNHEFCWACLGPHDGHDFSCNRYNQNKPEEDENKNRRLKAKQAIEKYMHYYERWANNEKSRKLAMKDLGKLQTVQLKVLSHKQNRPETELQFTVKAWLQIIECRRVLKWTYAYGYYLPENEPAKKDFFEYLQGEAEKALEKLHHCAEKELNQFVTKSADSIIPFDDYRRKLVGLTKVNKTYFDNLVKAWENGLADVWV